MRRIVLYGATGYMGGLTAHAMVASGARPVLAGRDKGRLDAVAARISQAVDGATLETAVAGAAGPGPLRDLLGPRDVLVSTAGPFLKVGRLVVAAAVDAGVIYLDSSGEPPFIRAVFDEFAPRAERTGAVLLTAFGYDYVPGNLAGALALEEAGPGAAQVRVGYFVRGDIRRAGSAGTRASVAGVLLEPLRTSRRSRLTARQSRRSRLDPRSISRCPGCGRGRRERRERRESPRRRRSPTWVSFSAGSGGARPGGGIRSPRTRIRLRRSGISPRARRTGVTEVTINPGYPAVLIVHPLSIGHALPMQLAC